MFLHEQNVWTRWMHRNIMNAMTDFSGRVGKFGPRVKSFVDGSPCLATVVSAERTRSGDGNKDPLRIARIENDRMQTHTTCAWLPEISFRCAQPGKFIPSLSTIR